MDTWKAQPPLALTEWPSSASQAMSSPASWPPRADSGVATRDSDVPALAGHWQPEAGTGLEWCEPPACKGGRVPFGLVDP